MLLGENVDYTFTSDNFGVGKRTSITMTAGSIFNPQNLSAISLQRYDNGSYSEVARIICDGGAVCPLSTLPVERGAYRVVLEGFGSNAVLGAILRE